MIAPNLPETLTPKTTRVTLGVVGLFLVVVLFQVLWQTPASLVTKLPDKLDLSGSWDTCVLPDGVVRVGSHTFCGSRQVSMPG